MEKIYHIIGAIAASAAIIGCTKEIPVSTSSMRLMSITPEIEQNGTRATLINTSSEMASFSLNVYSTEKGLVAQNRNVSYSSGNWSYGDAIKWPADFVYYFYACYPVSTAFNVSITGIAQFTYSPYDSNTTATIKGQTDYMFGYYKGVGEPEKDSNNQDIVSARILFSHPLASLQFTEGTIASGTHITEISISGIYDEATCTPSYHGHNTVKYSWATTEEPSCEGTLSQTINYTAGTAGAKIGNPFVLIPQKFTPDAPMTISVSVDGKAQPLTGTIDLTDLRAGETATFKINIPE